LPKRNRSQTSSPRPVGPAPYTITLEEEQTLLWQNGGCTTTEELLNQNLEQIRLCFRDEDERVDPGHSLALQARSGDRYCALVFISVSNWPEGSTELKVEVTFRERIDDGIADGPEGTQTYPYEVTLK
jgi:hypothetical protein